MSPPPTVSTGVAIELDPPARRAVMCVVCFALMLVTASMSALNLALPDIGLDLSASLNSLT
ncbi:hypothetical protein [Streptomyces sp. NPDC054837]